MFVGSNNKRMKLIALLVFKKDYFLLGTFKIQDGRHLDMQIRWPLTLTHFFHPKWSLMKFGDNITSNKKKFIQCGDPPLISQTI